MRVTESTEVHPGDMAGLETGTSAEMQGSNEAGRKRLE
jgi:hypothetical protein